MIYVLKFEHPLGRPGRHSQAQFYLGYCEDDRLADRLAEHAAGYGAAITRAAVQRGYRLELVLAIPGDRSEERRLKNWKNHRRVIQRYARESVHSTVG